MSTNLIPLNLDAALPAHLATATQINSDLGTTAKPRFPFMSLEGKQWTIVRNKDDSETLVNDEGDPRSAIEVVILRVNKLESKVYYEGKYEKGSNAKPTCYSNNGATPELDAQVPQAKSCSVCPHAAWGTGGNGKGFACRGTRRIAIAAPDKLDDPMLVRVPPTSIAPLKEYQKTLRNYPYNSVVTRIKFDMASPTPLLTFTPIGALSAESYATASAMYDTGVVQAICGLDETAPAVDTPAPAPRAVAAPAPAPAEPPAVVEPPAIKAAKAKKEVKPTTELDSELDEMMGAL